MNKNSKGFSLIEIIVVLIILGALAMLAVPSYFSWITKSKAAEALVALGNYKNQIEPCLMAHPQQESKCKIQTSNLGSFTYSSDPPCAPGSMACPTSGLGDGAPDYAIFAYDPNDPNRTTNNIQLIRSGGYANSPTITCVAGGTYAGIC